MSEASGRRRVAIERLGSRGEGVAATAQGPLYAPYALPGEVVEVEGAGERAALVEVIEASPDRIAPVCGYFTQCGGCAVQTLAEAPYAAWKRGLVVAALAQAGFADAERLVAPLVAAHGAGRRRVVMHVRAEGRGEGLRLRAGFTRARSHEVLDIAACPILAPPLAGAFDLAREVGRILAPLDKPLDVQATATEGGLDVDIRGAGRGAEAMRAALVALADARDLARLSLHGATLIERRAPTVVMGACHVVPPAGGFLQATEAGEQALADLAKAACGGAKRIADLFCGCGAFALRLMRGAEIHAADSDPDAVAALARAARIPGARRVNAEARDLFRRPLSSSELATFDALVFDPPRAGAEAQARQIAASAVATVVAVSCHPGTFARDARLLVEGGYALDAVTPVDQFRHSAHVELVATFRKARPPARRRGLLSR